MRIFSPKHQKLVNQCYPSGRTPDKKPKSSETSYLLYYVNSRRSKLEKVSTYLIKRTNVDLSHRRVGNVAVTLEIMDAIVQHCKENLNIFVKDFLNIMIKILSNNSFNNDVSIVELVEKIFATVCRNVDGALSGDAEFINLYSKFAKLYSDVATEILHNSDIVLQGCIDISHTMDLASNPQISHFIPSSVKYALEVFVERNPRFTVIDLGSSVNQTISKSLSKIQSKPAGLDGYKGSDLSIDTLQAYFTTTETDKLTLAIKSLLEFLQRLPNKDLLQFICNGIPVQLRYIVVMLLTRHLTDVECNADPLVSLRLISSLLISDVSIVGLSIMDMMRKILKFQLDNETDIEVVDQCRVTIGDLNNKLYYRGQTADMLFELELRLQSTSESSKIERVILTGDVNELLSHMTKPCIGLELFINLAPFMNSQGKLKLFEAVDDRFSGGSLLLQFFAMINEIHNQNDEEVLMHLVFEKYKSMALLSGLSYFTENVAEPTTAYYYYHWEAANFLHMNDYRQQVDLRRRNQTLFSKDELIGFYSDERLNKYAKKGTQILNSNPQTLSNSDLFSDQNPQRTNTPSEINGLNRDLTVGNLSGNDSARGSISKSLNGNGVSESRSWRGLKAPAPKVTDLKKAISSPKKHLAGRSGTLRGSQSVKSKVTDISYLLNELRNNKDSENTTHENTSPTVDPDESQPVVLSKNDIARSTSMKLTPPRAQQSYEELNLANVNQSITNSSPLKLAETPTDQGYSIQNFQDAQDDFALNNNTSSSRGIAV